LSPCHRFPGRRARAAALGSLLALYVISPDLCIAAPPLGEPEYGFSIDDRLAQYRWRAVRRLAPYFQAADVEYPPRVVVLVGLKQERRLELFAGPSREELKFIRYYGVLAASGGMGPKLREGDRQVPEGLYTIAELNPNSQYHLSLRIGYPNDFDQLMGRVEGRRNLGGGIFIHGGSESAGCLAMSDPVAEELFTLVAETGIRHVSVILSPVDMRRGPAPTLMDARLPSWSPHLYAIIGRALRALPPTYTHWASNRHRIE
jgi:hypothetical protein